MNTLKTNSIATTDEQGRSRVTGETLDNKHGIHTVILNNSGIPVSINIDLTDKISTFDLYNLNNLIDGDPMYIGQSTLDGKWLIKKFSESIGSMLYANISNNPAQSTYDDAWTNKLILTFNKINEITGV